MASKVLAALTCATAIAVKLPPSRVNPVTLGLCLGVTWVLTLQALLLRRLLAPEGSAPPSYGYAAAAAGGEGDATRGAAAGGDDAAAGGAADGGGDDFRGWLWLAAASQASLKPKLPEAQGTAKRFGTLRGSRLLLTTQAGGGGEPPVEVDLRGCEVFAAPGTPRRAAREATAATGSRADSRCAALPQTPWVAGRCAAGGAACRCSSVRAAPAACHVASGAHASPRHARRSAPRQACTVQRARAVSFRGHELRERGVAHRAVPRLRLRRRPCLRRCTFGVLHRLPARR